MYNLPEVTLLITHYNRSASLERLLKAFSDLDCHFGDIVVSDDCSKPEHLDRLIELKEELGFTLVTTPKNGGLGNNINKGQEVVKTPYTLYVQEDFVPTEVFPDRLVESIGFMNEDKSLDIIRYYAYFRHPILEPFKNGYSYMKFNFWNQNHIKFYLYSDHPHLRRSTFLEKFGRYAEGLNVNVTEFYMSLRFIQRKGKGLFYENFTTLFDQKNTSSEPSTANRDAWRESSNVFILALRSVYLRFRWLKNTYQLLTKK
jgi:glycosyltransferase involved in cell wall biosynthesis